MTAKKQVLSVLPKAVCIPQRAPAAEGYVVKLHSRAVGVLGFGLTIQSAWEDASRHPMVLKPEPVEPVSMPDDHDTHVAAHVTDMVNHPPHYQSEKGVECIVAIEAAMTIEEFRGYLRGNCLKYLWRAEKKGREEDLKKAAWYLNKLIETPKPS